MNKEDAAELLSKWNDPTSPLHLATLLSLKKNAEDLAVMSYADYKKLKLNYRRERLRSRSQSTPAEPTTHEDVMDVDGGGEEGAKDGGSRERRPRRSLMPDVLGRTLIFDCTTLANDQNGLNKIETIIALKKNFKVYFVYQAEPEQAKYYLLFSHLSDLEKFQQDLANGNVTIDLSAPAVADGPKEGGDLGGSQSQPSPTLAPNPIHLDMECFHSLPPSIEELGEEFAQFKTFFFKATRFFKVSKPRPKHFKKSKSPKPKVVEQQAEQEVPSGDNNVL